MAQTFSLYKIDNDQSFSFDPSEYSRFKFGDDVIAEKFGRNLAKRFISQFLEATPPLKQLVVLSSPYAFIPTATYAMKNYFVFELNRWLAQNDMPVVEEAKVYRTVTYKEDYGELDASARLKLINNDKFYLDKYYLEGKTLLFLDDIKITGSHERMILKMIQAHGLDNEYIMLYYAELVDLNIHPKIENYLNYYQVKSIFDLNDIINSGSFVFNTRVVKYILSSDHQPFRIFIEEQAPKFLTALYDMALGNSYHNMKEYSINLAHIRNLIFHANNELTYGN